MRVAHATNKAGEEQEAKEPAARWRGTDFAKGSGADEPRREQRVKSERKSETETDQDPNEDRDPFCLECGYGASASSARINVECGKSKYR